MRRAVLSTTENGGEYTHGGQEADKGNARSLRLQ
jgi:hypothetical protein